MIRKGSGDAVSGTGQATGQVELVIEVSVDTVD